MTEQGQAALINIWNQHRNRMLSYGQALHALLPAGEPSVSLHGRDLRPQDEGVGFQFQYTLVGDLYNGDVVSACFVVQLTLEAAGIIVVKVDAAPMLEYRDCHYEVFGRRNEIVPIGDKFLLRQFFRRSLTPSATHFFSRVRAGEPMDEFIAGFAGPAPTP